MDVIGFTVSRKQRELCTRINQLMVIMMQSNYESLSKHPKKLDLRNPGSLESSHLDDHELVQPGKVHNNRFDSKIKLET